MISITVMMAAFEDLPNLLPSPLLVRAESNGLARTPAAGWNSWNWVGARVDCDAEPNRCLNERLMKEMADALISTGMAAMGYDIVNLSEGWPYKGGRAANGSLMWDPQRFPSGIPALSNYIHSRGLKFGIYLDVGTLTCAKYPGSYGYEEIDAATIVEWGADYVWMDGCNYPGSVDDFIATYAKWGALFNSSGRPIIWEASLPAYIPKKVNLNYISSFSHEWRYYNDITPSWISIMDILDYSITNNIFSFARPGQWPLMDMLEVGNDPLTLSESRTHFSLWAMFAQPLHAGNDIRNMSKELRDIFLNEEVLAIDRDPLGSAGHLVARFNGSRLADRSVGSCSFWPLAADPKAHLARLHPDCVQGAECCDGMRSLERTTMACCGDPSCLGLMMARGAQERLMGCPLDRKLCCKRRSNATAQDVGALAFSASLDNSSFPSIQTPPVAAADDKVRVFVKPGLGLAKADSRGDIYARKLSDASVAILMLNRGTIPLAMCVGWQDVGLNPFEEAYVRDVWARADRGHPYGRYCAEVQPHDVVMLRVQQ